MRDTERELAGKLGLALGGFEKLEVPEGMGDDGGAPSSDSDDEDLDLDAINDAAEAVLENTPGTTESDAMAYGLVLIAVSGLLFSFMTVLTKVASESFGLGSFEIVFISAVARWACLLCVLIRSKEHPLGKPELRKLLAIRCCCGFVGICSATFAFTKMPIGDATAIVFVSPAWASIFGRVILKEPLGCIDIFAVVTSFFGVLLVAKPSFLFGGEVPADGSPIAPFIALLASMGSAGVVVTVRLIGTRGGLHPAVLAHAYAAFVVLVSPLGFLLPGQRPHFTQSSSGTFVAVCVGLLATLNQLAMNTGMQRVPSGLGAMMRNVDIVATILWQVTIFHNSADGLSLTGSIIIILCTAGQALRKWRNQRQKDLGPSPAIEFAPVSLQQPDDEDDGDDAHSTSAITTTVDSAISPFRHDGHDDNGLGDAEEAAV